MQIKYSSRQNFLCRKNLYIQYSVFDLENLPQPLRYKCIICCVEKATRQDFQDLHTTNTFSKNAKTIL